MHADIITVKGGTPQEPRAEKRNHNAEVHKSVSFSLVGFINAPTVKDSIFEINVKIMYFRGWSVNKSQNLILFVCWL